MPQSITRFLTVATVGLSLSVAAAAAPTLQHTGSRLSLVPEKIPASQVKVLGVVSPQGPVQALDTPVPFYDCSNASDEGYYYNLATPAGRELDDGSLADGDNGPHTATSVTFALANTGATQNTYALIRFFTNIHEASAATPHVDDVEAGATLLGSFSVTLGSVVGALTDPTNSLHSYTVDISANPIVFPSHTFWCEETYYRNMALTVKSSIVTPLYASGPQNIGSNVDGAYADFNNTNMLDDDLDYSISDYFNFGADRTHGDPDAHVQDYLILSGPVAPATPVSIGAAIQGSPAISNGIAYFGADDGKLYAYTTAGNTPVAGFPVSISAALDSAVKLQARPDVFTGAGGTAIYLTTDQGHVVKVNADGTVAWKFGPTAPSTGTTPAVTSDGNVYVDLSPTGLSNNRYLFRLSDATGAATGMSPFLGAPSTSPTPRSPAVTNNLIYANVADGYFGDVVALDRTNLTVRATFAPNQDAFPPFVSGADAYVATKAGNIYKVNSATLAVDLAFGVNGKAAIGETISTQAFPYTSGTATTFYVGTSTGHIYAVDATTGAKTLFFSTPSATAIGGILVTLDGVVAFGTADGNFYQVPAANAAGATSTPVSGAIVSTPAYDGTSGHFYVVTNTGNTYNFPKS